MPEPRAPVFLFICLNSLTNFVMKGHEIVREAAKLARTLLPVQAALTDIGL